MLRLLTFVFCLLFATLAHPQNALLPLTMQQGLSHNEVRGIHLDRFGFLWIATAGGINRFDGNQVTELHAQNMRLTEMSFGHVLEDSQGRIWLNAEHTGLFLYQAEQGRFELFIESPRAQNHPAEATILSLIEQDSDHLLFVVNQKLYQLRISDKNLTTLLDLTELGHPNGWIRHLLLDEQQLFIAAYNGLIHLDLNSGKTQYLPHLPAEVTTPTEDQLHTKFLHFDHNSLWVGTVAGLYQIKRTDLAAYLTQQVAYQVTPWLAGQNIWRIAKQDSKLLIGSELGLYQWQYGQTKPEPLVSFEGSNQHLIDTSVIDFAVDKHQGIWLANRSAGLYYWHPQFRTFVNYTTANNINLSHNHVRDLLFIDQQLWLATENGLNFFDKVTGQSRAFLVNPEPTRTLMAGQIRRLAKLDGDLWLESAEGIQRFSLQEQKLIPTTSLDNAPFGRGASHLIGFADSLYFINGKKAYRYQSGAAAPEPLDTINNTLSMELFAQFLGELPDRSILLSTFDQVWRYWPEQSELTLIYQLPDYAPHLNRYANLMFQDHLGKIWVSFRGVGLYAFSADDLALTQQFTAENSALTHEILSIEQDKNNHLWFSSRQGIGKLSYGDFKLEFFSQADGLPFTDFTPRASAKLTENRLVFAAKEGLLLVAPEFLTPTSIAPQTTITELSILNSPSQQLRGYLNNRQVDLTANSSAVRIQFSTMNFQQNHKVFYQFWFDNNQAQAVEQQDNSLLLPNLPIGKHRFNVVAISPHHQLQGEPATILLHVMAPWWRTPLAYALYSFLSLFIFIIVILRRLRQQRALQQAHQQITVSEQRLSQALLSVNSGAFEWNAESNCIESERLPKMLGEGRLLLAITWQQHCSLIHPDDLEQYQLAWQHVLRHPETMLDTTYRLKHHDGRWLWFRDRAKVTDIAKDGTVRKIIGTYSNITETKANAEKARLFGEAFQQTRDWVVILDTRQRVLAANQSFCQAFGGIERYVDSPKVHHLGISLVRRRFYTKLLKTMQPGSHWQGEEQVITPDGRERPTLINVSAVGESNLHFYVLVFTDITAQKAAEDELRYLANYDTLTGLPNRALLMDRINHGIEKAKREGRDLALCFIDLDKFKNINDSLGHDVGDLLLKEVARRLKLTLRDSDTVARLGGDEFVVLLEDYKTNDNISHVARKMIQIISEPMLLLTDTVAVSPSIGIALYPADALTGTELMKHADVAMYHAKEAGRNNFQFFISEMNEKAHMQLARETRLRKGIQQNEFINYYQPIIDSREHSVVGVEVLLRWFTPEGMVSPAEFIPLAEEMRLIVGMTQQLLERALQDIATWRAAGFKLYVSVNLTTQHLEQSALAETVIALLAKYQLPACALRFEITESALMRDQQGAIRTMHALSDAGIKLALDDFGTGYSSLKYLKELPLDAIKIDRSFVQDIGIDHNDETIIDAMLSMAASLGMYCVAEGVETEQQLAFFNQRQCYLIQGFLFSKPLPANELLNLLKSDRFVLLDVKD